MENKYDMGDFVVVNKVQTKNKKYSQNCKVTWLSTAYPVPRLGRIVGLCKRQDGVVEWNIDWETGYDEGPYLVLDKIHTFYLVRYGWFNKPVCVAAENMRLATLGEINELPGLFQNRQPMSEQAKQYLREDSQNWPRKSDGKFAKGNMLNHVEEKSND